MTLDVSRLRDTIREVLASGPPLRLAILFGSHARGAANPDSDVDVGFIPRDPDLPLAAELELQGRLERACAAAVDLLRVDQGSTLLRWEAARTAIPILADPPYELSRFLASAALDHAELMATLGAGAERFRRRLAEVGRPVTPAAPTARR